MCDNEVMEASKGQLVKKQRKASLICRRSRKGNIPQTEDTLLPYDPKIPHEDDCLMQED